MRFGLVTMFLPHRLERNLLAFRFGFGVVSLRREEADGHRDDVDD